MKREWVFDIPSAKDFGVSRQSFTKEFLASVRQQTDMRTALDVGCGVGEFSKFLLGLDFSVVGVDGREENIREAQRRYPQIRFRTANAENLPLAELGSFDLVLCFGLLYHLENPFHAIRNLYSLTSKVLLIETMCAPSLEPLMQLVDEGKSENQGLNYVAFYPSEACLIKMLYRTGFPYVYGFAKLPDHELFRASFWQRKQRTMLAAAKAPLNIASLALQLDVWGSWEILLTKREKIHARLIRLATAVRRLWPKPSSREHIQKT